MSTNPYPNAREFDRNALRIEFRYVDTSGSRKYRALAFLPHDHVTPFRESRMAHLNPYDALRQLCAVLATCPAAVSCRVWVLPTDDQLR